MKIFTEKKSSHRKFYHVSVHEGSFQKENSTMKIYNKKKIFLKKFHWERTNEVLYSEKKLVKRFKLGKIF